jgi:ABC-type multidrug transport system fused ATPase/permease subunit
MIDEVLNQLPKENETGTAILGEPVETICFENVTFAYLSRSESNAVYDLSLSFSRGKMIAITGKSGAGKSTIADLIIRLYAPTTGKILANGMDIQKLALSDWRRRIGYVSQESFLFNASLRDNITLFDTSIPSSRWLECAQLAQVDEFVGHLPQGYDTVVGDRGVQLSGGQRQRVAVARALARTPEILLLDEATSALDNLTEQAFQRAISQLRTRCVLIVIAHRLSTISSADEIIVLSQGQIVERGTHESLLAAQGHYWQLNHSPYAVLGKLGA